MTIYYNVCCIFTFALPSFQDNKIEEAITNYNSRVGCNISTLKENQRITLNYLLEGKDCICSLSTGYGKSHIYELLPFLDTGCLVIVVVQLNAIISQQLEKLGNLAVSLCPMKDDFRKLKTGVHSYLFCHPEQILDNTPLFDVFRSEDFSLEERKFIWLWMRHIAFWSGERSSVLTFKSCTLYQLRSIFKCQVLALSATVTHAGKQCIFSSLIMKNYEIISESPVKNNISH